MPSKECFLCSLQQDKRGRRSYIILCLMSFCKNMLVMVLTITCLNVHAQETTTTPWTFSLETHVGQIVKHSPKFIPDVKGISTGLELGYERRSRGDKPWQHGLKYPIYGYALALWDYGDPEIFGQSVSAYTHISLPLYRHKAKSLYFRMGWGLGYISKFFDKIENPTNNVVGSPWNLMIPVSISWDQRIHKKYTLKAGIAFSHWSNGKIGLPNLGVNTLSLNLGIRQSQLPLNPSAFKMHELPAYRKWGVHARFSLGFLEGFIPDGPVYQVPVFDVAGVWRNAYTNKVMFGMEYEFFGNIYAFVKHNLQFTDPAEQRRESTRIAIFVGDEFRFHHLGVAFYIGVYTRKSFLQPKAFYEKFNLRYYLYDIDQQKRFNTFLDITLKAHLIDAEYFSFGLGVEF